MRNTKTVTVYSNQTEHQVAFPARWQICPACEGNATTTRHIECDGGGFTAEEWRDACDDDEDFADNYFSGRYDRPCPDCDGKGRIQTIDEDQIHGWRQTILYKAYLAQEKDEADYQATCEMERRMGA